MRRPLALARFGTTIVAVAACPAFAQVPGASPPTHPVPRQPAAPSPLRPAPSPAPEDPSRKPASGDTLAELVDPAAKIKVLVGDIQFAEGPLWIPGGDNKPGFLLFSDIPADTIYKLDPAAEHPKAEKFLSPSGHSNGLTLDAKGRLLIAQHDGHVARFDLEHTGSSKEPVIDVLVSKFEDKRLNSPNDLIVAADGSIVFTDPPYGLRPPLGPDGRKRELEFCGVYRLSPSGKLMLLTKDLAAPNGLALSPDEKTLYIADTSNGQIRAFPVKDDATIGPGKVFATNDAGSAARRGRSRTADGVKVDQQGNIYTVGPAGIWVYTSQGHLRGVIPVEHSSPTNLCFGGEDYTTLFITTADGVCSIPVKVPGVHRDQDE